MLEDFLQLDRDSNQRVIFVHSQLANRKNANRNLSWITHYRVNFCLKGNINIDTLTDEEKRVISEACQYTNGTFARTLFLRMALIHRIS